MKWKKFLQIGFIVGALAAIPLLKANSSGTIQYSGWGVYWDLEDSLRPIEERPQAMQEVGIFAYGFDAQGNLVPSSENVEPMLKRLAALESGKRPRLLISFVNDVIGAGQKLKLKDPAIVHQNLVSPQARAKHIEQILSLSASADGIEIDYENMWGKDRELFSLFIEELAGRAHEHGLFLSVIIQPRLYDRVGDGAGAIDWKVIAGAADQVKLMAYHMHWAGAPPGPLATPDWVAQLADFVRTQVPNEKLCVVLTLHGFDWPSGREGKSLEYSIATELMQQSGAQLKRDGDLTPHFNYTDSQGVAHEVWFEDARSLNAKLKRLESMGIKQIGLWRLGTGDPAFWQEHFKVNAALEPAGD